MVKFKNAAKGLKQVFVAQFLAIFGGIAGGLVLTPAFSDNDAAKAIFGLVGIGLMIAALVVELVGLHAAGKDNASFKLAFSIALATLFVGLLVGVMSIIMPDTFGSEVAKRVISIISAVLEIIGIYCVYRGIGELAAARGEDKLASTAHVLWNIVMITLVGVIVVSIFALLGAVTVAGILAIVVLILGLVSDVAYLVLLGKAMNRMA